MYMNKTKLIEDNMNLVYHIIHRHYPTYRNDEDLKQVGMVGLCKAANTWDGVSSKFSTYAYTCIVNTIRLELRNRTNTIPHVSLDNQINDDSEANFIDLICNEEIDFLFNAQIDSFVNKLTQREKDIIKCLSSGMTQQDIATQWGISKQAIGSAVRNIRIKWRKYNGENQD